MADLRRGPTYEFTVAGEAQMGTCKADVATGAACDIMLGPTCAPPNRCVVTGTSTAGTGTIPDPSLCE